jgi:hypothetical protein
LSPVASVPIFIGIGLNYRKHAEEAKASSENISGVRIRNSNHSFSASYATLSDDIQQAIG